MAATKIQREKLWTGRTHMKSGGVKAWVPRPKKELRALADKARRKESAMYRVPVVGPTGLIIRDWEGGQSGKGSRNASQALQNLQKFAPL